MWESKYQPQLEKEVTGLNLSAWARDRVEPEMARFDAYVRTSTTHDGYAAQMERDKQDLLAGVERDGRSGNYEGAFGGIDALVRTGHLTEAQGQEQKAQLQQEVRQRALGEFIKSNPREAAEVFAEGARTGKSERVPFFEGNKAAFRQWEVAARKEVLRREVETQHDVHGKIAKGELQEAGAIRAAVGSDLPASRVEALVKLAGEDPVYDPQGVTRLRTAVRGFQAEGDRDWMKYQALQERIEREAPKAMQAGLADELYAAWQGRGQRDTTGESWKRHGAGGGVKYVKCIDTSYGWC